MVAWKSIFIASIHLLSKVTVILGSESNDPEVQQEAEDLSASPNIKISVHASFPQSEVFGVKLVNGRTTQSVLSFENEDTEAITVVLASASLWTKDNAAEESRNIRNLTSSRYKLQIPPGEKESLSYNFGTELHPQDIRLKITTSIMSNKGIFAVQAFDEMVSIVEAPTSIFDPQILFLYVVLASMFGGTGYFVYTTWISTIFPQKRRNGKGGERAKSSTGRSKKVDPDDQVAVLDADGPAVTSGSKAYDESWIPVQHLQRPEAKRSKSSNTKQRG